MSAHKDESADEQVQRIAAIEAMQRTLDDLNITDIDGAAALEAVEADDALVDDVVQRIGSEYAEVLSAVEDALLSLSLPLVSLSQANECAPIFVREMTRRGFIWEKTE